MDRSYPHVDLVWWRPKAGLNFGDVLSEVIVTKILADRGRSLKDQSSVASRLLAVGSILHLARDGDVVWGSGVNGKMPADRHVFTDLDVRAVRGPLTARFLLQRGINVPKVYGDPALLLPVLFPELKRTHKESIVVVPNLHDIAVMKVRGIDFVSPFAGWNVCVDRITGADLVVASSLHAIIIAEAFGVPARYARFSAAEDSFKYDDYALGTGRGGLEPARSIEEAIAMGGAPPIRFDPEALLAAFPIDLWKSDRRPRPSATAGG